MTGGAGLGVMAGGLTARLAPLAAVEILPRRPATEAMPAPPAATAAELLLSILTSVLVAVLLALVKAELLLLLLRWLVVAAAAAALAALALLIAISACARRVTLVMCGGKQVLGRLADQPHDSQHWL